MLQPALIAPMLARGEECNEMTEGKIALSLTSVRESENAGLPVITAEQAVKSMKAIRPPAGDPHRPLIAGRMGYRRRVADITWSIAP